MRDEVQPSPLSLSDSRTGADGNTVSHGKVTPAVRKILQSQKTFANYLADYEALIATGAQPVSLPPASNPPRVAPAPPTDVPPKRSHKKKDPNAPTKETSLRRVSTAAVKPEAIDTPMTGIGAPIVFAEVRDPPAHPRDGDPLLVSRIPTMPTQEEIKKLLAAMPLSYNEARGTWTEDDRRKPIRHFCEVCGYWGRVKCMRCGGRVCALECLNVHQEECFTRYGA